MRLLFSKKFISRLQWYRHLNHSVTQTKVLQKSQKYLDKFSHGTKIHGFTVKQAQEIPELLLSMVRLTHDKTGADYIHVAREDNNNVFNVGFRTTPMDSTGVAHILEHTVLCGSKKYPCRDPFMKMANRSMATYMNALTGLDYTMYPFATQNPKDFKNLMNVYLDAVFAPCLRELDFRQEGWRLENENVDDPKSPLTFRGVVFNEMKGAFANSDQLFAQRILNNILPSHTYAHVSGGEPLYIVDLTWAKLQKFHKSHYHPSNARFYTYGNFPLEDHLETINDKLSSFNQIKTDTGIPVEKRWDSPREVEIECRPDPLLPNPQKNASVSFSYLLGCTSETQETATLQILSLLLISEPNSPFYKALLEPNIGSNYSPYTGYDVQTREGVFSIGLQGVSPSDIDKVCNIIQSTFDDIINKGFETRDIEAVLHKIEIDNKLVTSNFGLHLAMFMMPFWNHEANVIDILQINKIIQRFRQDLADNPRFLQDKVKQYFNDNPHRLKLIMRPNESFEANLMKSEKSKLEKFASALREEEKNMIFILGKELRTKQENEEDISCLPTLKIADIEKTAPKTDLENCIIGSKPVQLCVQPTNGLTHFRGFFSTESLPAYLKPLLPLFCGVSTKLGAGDLDYKLLAQEIDLKTGGLSISTHIAPNLVQQDSFEQGISLYSHCLDRNINDMFRLWKIIFNSIQFDNIDRLSTLIQIEASNLISSISDTGSAYAVNRASSSLSTAAALKNQFGGMPLITEMRRLAEKSDLSDVITDLQTIANVVFAEGNSRFAINSTLDSVKSATAGLEQLLIGLHSKQPKEPPANLPEDEPSLKCHYVLPFPVNYVGKSVMGVSYKHNDFAPLSVLAALMTNKFLHREIREKGGAYGGGATFQTNGIFSFYSYRDPNSLKTLNAFDEAAKWAEKGEFSQQDIDEAKLSVFQNIDKPISPGNRGSRDFLNGVSDETFQTYREKLFSASKDDLIRVTLNYLSKPKKTGVCLLGPACNDIKPEDDWSVITEYKDV